MPVVDLFTEDGETYYIGDGIHRCLAALAAKKASILARVHEGGLHAARVFACQANKTHGLHRTTADKRHAVRLMLELQPKWSGRKIADHVGVGSSMVHQMRRSLEDSGEIQATTKREGIDGKTREIPGDSAEIQESQLRAARSCVETACNEGGQDDADFNVEEIEAIEVRFDVETEAAEYRKFTRGLSEFVTFVRRRIEDPKKGPYLADKATHLIRKAEGLRAQIVMLTPGAECSACSGSGCNKCQNSGFVTRQMIESRG